jgi:hypothetical protein
LVVHGWQAYVKEQIAQYQKYLQECREQHYRPTSVKLKGGKKGKKASAAPAKAGPFKFTYKDLQKQVQCSPPPSPNLPSVPIHVWLTRVRACVVW